MNPLLPAQKNSLLSTLKRLLDTQESGELVFNSESGTRRFVVQSGYLVDFISSRTQDDLACFLLGRDLLSRGEYDLLASRAQQGFDVELLILESESIETRVLHLQLEARILEHLLELGVSSSEECGFLPLAEPPRRTGSLRLPLARAILELIRIHPVMDEREILTLIGGADRLLHLSAAAGSLPTHVPLTPQESFVLSRLSTPISFRQLLDIVPFSRSQLLGFLWALLSIDLVSLEASGQSRTAAPSKTSSSERFPADPPPAAPRDAASDALVDNQRMRADALLNELLNATPYQVLGVPEGATAAQIKAAYHQLAKEFHPDRFFGAAAQQEAPASVRAVFEKIRDAYQFLKDEGAHRQDPAHPRAPGISQRDPTPEELEKTARASHNQGVHFYQQHDFFAAVQHFREAVRIQPAVARYHHSLARALMRNPRWRKEAEDNFSKAIELDEFNADYRVSLGLLYLEAGMPRKAEAHFRDALAWDSENQAARRELHKLQSTAQGPSWLNKILGRKKS